MVIEMTINDWMKQGPQLVRDNPALELRITDVNPGCNRGGWDFSYTENYGFRPDDMPTSVLPKTIFTSLEEKDRLMIQWMRGFNTPEQALAAVNEACIRWAKSQQVSS